MLRRYATGGLASGDLPTVRKPDIGSDARIRQRLYFWPALASIIFISFSKHFTGLRVVENHARTVSDGFRSKPPENAVERDSLKSDEMGVVDSVNVEGGSSELALDQVPNLRYATEPHSTRNEMMGNWTPETQQCRENASSWREKHGARS